MGGGGRARRSSGPLAVRLAALAIVLTGCGTAAAGGGQDGASTATTPVTISTTSATTTTTTRPLFSPTAPPRGPCPPSGYVMWFGPEDAAMGLRVVSLRLTNCGRKVLQLRGYPVATLLDERERPLPVRLEHGVVTDGIAVPKVRSVRLAPGGSASSELSWRLLVLDDGSVSLTGRHLRVAPGVGRPAQLVDVLVDVGTTRRWHATAWH